ncbi:hypothetical protein C8F04DRAFT_1387911 [Mycena alexandri]|uniref:EthD domain-containing protein n=1 Tax=Mycena alexandri TaxID=1745969 RepID=A0AAD6XDV6_9AGAR|nr:hypothetical protein C8F04DRAFT_1387911 [Mycena alexandri]
MSIPPASQSLLLVHSIPAANIAAEDFNAWHASRHAAHLAMAGITSGLRYKAIDGKQPTWMALYETTSTDLPPVHVPFAIEQEVVSRLERNSYTLITSRTHPNTRPTAIPADILYLFHLDFPPEREDEFNEWYDGEQTNLYMKVPGWLRLRRYRLHSYDDEQPQVPRRFFTLHEFNNPEFADTPEYMDLVMGTERVREITKAVVGVEVRVFELQRE